MYTVSHVVHLTAQSMALYNLAALVGLLLFILIMGLTAGVAISALPED